jgi:hypothetical protein
MKPKQNHSTTERSGWTRRQFVITSGAAALAASRSVPLSAADTSATDTRHHETIDFPGSYLYCAPTKSGIWVRVQVECRGTVTDLASGATDEYVMGVMAKTGLTPDPHTGKVAPGYDYWIIFSKTHVFTKRSHSSAYLKNPTVLEHKDFGEANWRFRRVPAELLRSAADVSGALKNWRRMSAKTVFISADGARQFAVEYPVKWGDYSLQGEAFRIETGPLFLLDPNKQRVGRVPEFEDFQWAHVDFHSFDRVRLLVEQETSLLADATFVPPVEDGRENRKNPAVSEAQVQEIQDALNSSKISLPHATVSSLLSTEHYSQANDVPAKNELYVLAD